MENNLKEQELIRGVSLNDKNAIACIYKDNFSLIQNLIIRNNGTEEDAKDVFQEAMIVFYEKVKTGNFELNCQIATYLYAVSRRLWLKRLQMSSRYDMQFEEFDNLVYTEEDLEVHEKRDKEFGMMEHALSELGEPCRSLLEAYYLQKQSMQDIASRFGYTNADNAKNQKYKCLIRLRKLFFAQYKTEGK